MPNNSKLIFLIHNFEIGGVQKVIIHLARAFHDAGYPVAIYPLQDQGPLRAAVSGIEILDAEDGPEELSTFPQKLAAWLSTWRWLHHKRARKSLRYASNLARTIRHSKQPTLLFAGEMLENCVAAQAIKLAQEANVKTLMCLSGHVVQARQSSLPSANWPASYVRRCLSGANAVIAVSEGLANEGRRLLGGAKAVDTIYNPVITEQMRKLVKAPANHPWATCDDVPLIISAGRFSQEKDFHALIDAFAQVCKQRKARLMLLGYNPASNGQLQYRDALRAQTESLGIAESVALEPATDNPYALINAADVYALSSPAEGFGNALVEALYCGLAVVSTDCPSGPREILDGGRFGRLVPVGDSSEMARALIEALDSRPDKAVLRARAESFSQERAFLEYQKVITGLFPQKAELNPL